MDVWWSVASRARRADAVFRAGLCQSAGRALGILALAALGFVALASGPARAEGPEISHYTLANGLEIVVIPDHRTPVVTHMVWYKVGSADETPGKSGLAHFLEHLMFKGTAKNPAGRFSQTLATIGGQENAFTTDDYTAFFQRIAKEYPHGDGLRSRSHDRARSYRRQRIARARRGARRVQHAGRKQSGRTDR